MRGLNRQFREKWSYKASFLCIFCQNPCIILLICAFPELFEELMYTWLSIFFHQNILILQVYFSINSLKYTFVTCIRISFHYVYMSQFAYQYTFWQIFELFPGVCSMILQNHRIQSTLTKLNNESLYQICNRPISRILRLLCPTSAATLIFFLVTARGYPLCCFLLQFLNY